MAYKQKGFTPFTQEITNEEYQAKKDAKYGKNRMGKRTISKNKHGRDVPQYYNQSTGDRVGAPDMPTGTPNVGEATLLPHEQMKLKRAMARGDQPMELFKGYKRGTHEYRRRSSEMNIHGNYLTNIAGYEGVPEVMSREKHVLHQKLSQAGLKGDDPEKNWRNRYTDFTGPNTYDKYGNPPKSLMNETKEDKAARHARNPDLYGPGTPGYAERMRKKRS